MRDHSTLPSKEEIAALPKDGGTEFNRLVFESSPYLLQHARNPVDWFPWGDEAFEKARAEDKPIFLSIGYSTCHWCHVMERESFENEKIANYLRENFISIKVDREELPDVDSYYMTTVQMLTGQGGWPMTVFLTHELKPFWGGTYFPPESKYGRYGFIDVLAGISQTWKTNRDGVLKNAGEIQKHIEGATRAAARIELTDETLAKFVSTSDKIFDSELGGFGHRPKFPRSHSMSLLLRLHKARKDENALKMVLVTLKNMAKGGIRDHLGGGFHRYSTDREWLVPHFEKMLYDQALISRTYVEAFQITGERLYEGVAREVFDYVLRDMTDEHGGFYSAEDADSEGVEGKFYVWHRSEIESILGADAELFCEVYRVLQDGNFTDEATGVQAEENILHLAATIEETAKRKGVDAGELACKLAGMRIKLFEVRKQRIHPYKDDKILADWNGLMIGALAFGGRALAEPRYVEAARKAAKFVLESMSREGRLLHRFRGGNAAIDGYLDDYAFLANGLMDLYEATFETRWLIEARRLVESADLLFKDNRGGGYFTRGTDVETTLFNPKDVYDGAIPSGNSAITLALMKLSRIAGEEKFEKAARDNLDHFSAQVAHHPESYPLMLTALNVALNAGREIVLAGDLADKDFDALRVAVNRAFLPDVVLVANPSVGETPVESIAPFVSGKTALRGKPAAYVCTSGSCQLPATDAIALSSLLL
ncbi:MAG: thioredoxin domain-containing protein [Planctomycetes bacterium]|nr:thioredoxin domain-containing protein [Planctomycetota bacterium]